MKQDDLNDVIRVDPGQLERLQSQLVKKQLGEGREVITVPLGATSAFIDDDNAAEADMLDDLFDDVEVLKPDE